MSDKEIRKIKVHAPLMKHSVFSGFNQSTSSNKTLWIDHGWEQIW